MDNDRAQPFVYSPLRNGQIRVLTVLPSQANDTLACKLEHIQSEEEHTCLSYNWGVSPAEKSILINGAAVLIRENLWQFLTTARRYGFARRIWIDALCINQTDGEEKNQQIPLMGHIYANASSAIVWMGLLDEEVAALLKLQNLIANDLWEIGNSETVKGGELDVFQDVLVPDWKGNDEEIRGSSLGRFAARFESIVTTRRATANGEKAVTSEWKAIRQLPAPSARDEWLYGLLTSPAVNKVHLHPYWTRAWIIQELRLSRKLEIMGPRQSVDLTVILACLHALLTRDNCFIPGIGADRKFYGYPTSMLRDYLPLDHNLFKTTTGDDSLSLNSCMEITMLRGCSIPRDRIYSVQSMVRCESVLPVDYGTDDEQLLWQVTNSCMKEAFLDYQLSASYRQTCDSDQSSDGDAFCPDLDLPEKRITLRRSDRDVGTSKVNDQSETRDGRFSSKRVNDMTEEEFLHEVMNRARLRNAEQEVEDSAEGFDELTDLHEALILCITAGSRIRAAVRIALVSLEYKLPGIGEIDAKVEELQEDFDRLGQRAYWATRQSTIDKSRTLSICFPLIYLGWHILIECSIAAKDLAIPYNTNDRYNLEKTRALLSERRLWCWNRFEQRWKKLPWHHRFSVDVENEIDEYIQTLSL